MSNWKNELKDSRSSSGNFTRMEVDLKLEVRNDKDGNPSFHYFDKTKGENGENMYTYKPLVGVIIGEANMLSAFDEAGSFRSSDFFSNNDTIIVFQRGEKVFSGNRDQCDQFLKQNSRGGRGKMIKVIYVLSDSGKMIRVETNMSLAIDQIMRVRSIMDDKMGVCKLDSYSEDHKYISKRTKESLGSLAKKNPPAFLLMEPGAEITDDFAEKNDLVGKVKNFAKYRSERTSANIPKEPSAIGSGKAEEKEFIFDAEDRKNRERAASTSAPKHHDVSQQNIRGANESDDLPF
jgi:hypothetical protein